MLRCCLRLLLSFACFFVLLQTGTCNFNKRKPCIWMLMLHVFFYLQFYIEDVLYVAIFPESLDTLLLVLHCTESDMLQLDHQGCNLLSVGVWPAGLPHLFFRNNMWGLKISVETKRDVYCAFTDTGTLGHCTHCMVLYNPFCLDSGYLWTPSEGLQKSNEQW